MATNCALWCVCSVLMEWYTIAYVRDTCVLKFSLFFLPILSLSLGFFFFLTIQLKCVAVSHWGLSVTAKHF